MPTFAYRAVDRDGRRVRGAADALAPAALTRELEARGLLVIDVEEREASTAVPRASSATRQAVLEVTRALAALLPPVVEVLPVVDVPAGREGAGLV